jgi:hypothetical protein
MNTDKYISVLDDNLWPVVVRHFSDRPWIFQEDNALCHVSLRANQWKDENRIRGQRLSSKTEIYLSVFMLPSIATKVPTP